MQNSTRRTKLNLEQLGERLVPTTIFNPSTGVLTIEGAMEPDTLAVSQSGDVTSVRMNGESNSFIGVKALNVMARAGSDIVSLANIQVPASVHLGQGDDRLTIVGMRGIEVKGGKGNDYIEGGSGDDLIDGGEGNDTILGKLGQDVIFGGEGDDLIYGGKGNDVLAGGNGNDRIYGGLGVDQISTGDGFDTVYADRTLVGYSIKPKPGGGTITTFYYKSDVITDTDRFRDVINWV